MYRGHTVGVVIPAYNEEGFVGDTLRSVPELVDRVYVVEDGSTDGTWQEIRTTAAALNDRRSDDEDDPFSEFVVPIRHEQNRGVGGAIKTGYLRAREEDVDLIAVMGADGQMAPEGLTDLMDPIVDGRADYTKGNRFLGRTSRGDMPAFRFVGNATLGAITKIASGYWNSGDPQSGYTVISKRALEETAVEDMYEFYGYCNDLLVKLNVAGMRVVDVPRPIIYGDEESHIKYHTYIPKVSGMLFKNFLWRLKTNYLVFDFHPLVAAYAVGGLASLLGLLGFVWALPGVGSFGTPLARGGAAAGFLLFGVLSFVLAMGMDMQANEGLSATLRPESDTGDGEQRAVPAGEPTPAGERAGEAPDQTVTVELGPREWAYVADAEVTDGGTPSPHEVAVEEVRERIRERLEAADDDGD
ncbi:glycosyltransferase family 2 protein [Halobacterium wangiae]|uniref:glycosyltransferase family 2 protein n=1 Tax=Halobacterium wangiae TaxID=2902623 RepID=UPI001E643AA4|nr:glycosyltransferase family 2 protein [Halobacterium wangiae]